MSHTILAMNSSVQLPLSFSSPLPPNSSICHNQMCKFLLDSYLHTQAWSSVCPYLPAPPTPDTL